VDNIPITKEIELMKVRIDIDYENKFCLNHFNFRFKIESGYYDYLIANPIDDAFRSGVIIEDHNKKILPLRIRYYLKFDNDKGYKITECNVEYKNGYIIMSLEMKMISMMVTENKE
jgi:hypothetical protein